MAQLIKSGRRKHRATGSDATAEFYTGFNLDGVMYYRNMSDVMPQYGTFTLQPDPVLYPFEDKDGIRMLAEGDVTFEIRVNHFIGILCEVVVNLFILQCRGHGTMYLYITNNAK